MTETVDFPPPAPRTRKGKGKGSAQGKRERLAALVARLRTGGDHSASALAAALNVTPRTIWRDVDTLRENGVPVTGTRGRGYSMEDSAALPPLHLSLAEIEALHLALAVLSDATDPGLAAAAVSLADKFDAALPENAPGAADWGFALHPFASGNEGAAHVPLLREAIREKKLLRLTRQGGAPELITPKSLTYVGRAWRLVYEADTGLEEIDIAEITRLIDTGAKSDRL